MSIFENRFCPLCSKMLEYKNITEINIYYCTTNFEFNDVYGKKLNSHYEVETYKSNSYQRIYIMPWAIDNFSNISKSRIYKVENRCPLSEGISVPFQGWKFIMEVPQIHADNEENLRSRINTLITFL